MPVKPEKVQCINPHTGHKMSIDAAIYNLFSKAIYDTLKQNKEGISFTDMVSGVKKCFKEDGVVFKGSVSWYAITVKYDMEARGTIEVLTQKGKKRNRVSPIHKTRK